MHQEIVLARRQVVLKDLRIRVSMSCLRSLNEYVKETPIFLQSGNMDEPFRRFFVVTNQLFLRIPGMTRIDCMSFRNRLLNLEFARYYGGLKRRGIFLFEIQIPLLEEFRRHNVYEPARLGEYLPAFPVVNVHRVCDVQVLFRSRARDIH